MRTSALTRRRHLKGEGEREKRIGEGGGRREEGDD